MTTSILSFGLFFFALALLTAVLLVPVAVLAGNVFHAWGTNSTVEWLVEAFRRVFIGSLRRRLMRKVNGQSLVNVDGSRQAYPYLAVTVAPDDVAALTGPGGSTVRRGQRRSERLRPPREGRGLVMGYGAPSGDRR